MRPVHHFGNMRSFKAHVFLGAPNASVRKIEAVRTFVAPEDSCSCPGAVISRFIVTAMLRTN